MGLQLQKKLAKYNPKVGIVILNWNNYEDTKECLQSIETLDYSSLEVVVVDGKSSDDSTKRIEQEFPDYRYIYLRKDTGYSGGNNAGIKFLLEKGVELILSLNNDVVLTPDVLKLLVPEIQKSEKIGMVGPRIYSYYDRSLFQLSGGYVDVIRSRPMPKWARDNNGKHYSSWPFTVKKLPAACLLMKREVIDDIGLMNENYFLYYADADWEKKAFDKGWLLCCVPEARVYHKVFSTTGKNPPKLHYYDTRDFLFFVKDHYSSLWLLYCMLNSFWQRCLSIFMKNRLEQAIKIFPYMLLGYYHFLKGKRGKGI